MSLYLSLVASIAGNGFAVVTLPLVPAPASRADGNEFADGHELPEGDAFVEGQGVAEGGSNGGACSDPPDDGADVVGYEVDGKVLGTAGDVHAGRMASSCGWFTGAESPDAAPVFP